MKIIIFFQQKNALSFPLIGYLTLEWFEVFLEAFAAVSCQLAIEIQLYHFFCFKINFSKSAITISSKLTDPFYSCINCTLFTNLSMPTSGNERWAKEVV